MTLLEIRNNLFTYFKDNDTLILPDNFNKIITISENIEMDTAIIKEALKTFITAGLIKEVDFSEGKKNKNVYILDQSLYKYEQSVSISGEIAFYIAQILNDLKDKNDPDKVNPLSINSSNIESLIILITELLKQHNKNLESPDEDSGNNSFLNN